MTRGRVATVSAVVVGVIVALLVVVLATRDPATDKQRDSPLVGKPAPALTARAVSGGRVDLDRYRGEWALVNFFATWCVPCRQEHPELVDLDESGEVNVISVVFQDSPETVQEFFDEQGGDWPVAEDTTGEITLSYGIAKLPESYLVAPDGTIVAKYIAGIRATAVQELIRTFR